MQTRSAGPIFVLSLIFVSMVLMSGCSSSPNPDLNLGGIDIEEVFSGQITRITQILGGVTDQASLNKAQGELEEVSMNFDDLIFNSQKLSENGQMALSILAAKEVSGVEMLAADVKRSPAMEKKLGGVMDGIVGKIRSMI